MLTSSLAIDAPAHPATAHYVLAPNSNCNGWSLDGGALSRPQWFPTVNRAVAFARESAAGAHGTVEIRDVAGTVIRHAAF